LRHHFSFNRELVWSVPKRTPVQSRDVAIVASMLRIAEHILETKTAEFDPAFLEDRYRTVLVEMLRSKQAELPKANSAPPPGSS
jgi:non-homologous end joining protein Ku